MLFVALKIKRAQKFFTYVDLVIARQNETDPSYHMLNQPASTGSANTAAGIAAPSWQGYVRSHWNSLEVNAGHQGEVGNWA